MPNPGPATNGFGSLIPPASNSQKAIIASVVFSPAAVAANTTAEQVLALPAGTGVLASDFITVNKPTAQAGLGIVGVRAAGVDSIAVTFSNNTAAAITPTAGESYLVKIERVSFVQNTFPY